MGDSGLYGPHSLTWRLTRERAMLLGGPRALLMQLAHPLVAAGVADHSNFRHDPLARLRRTLDATLAIVFGSTSEAEASAAGINAVHARVTGALKARVGRFEAGTPYDAKDPDLLLWVHATLVDTTLEVYPLFVRALSPAELEAAYEESKLAARMLRVPDPLIPPTLNEFRRYVRDTLASDSIAVGAEQRELARSVLYPNLRLVPRWALGLGAAITAGLLPEKLRSAYGLELSPGRKRAFEAAQRLVKGMLPALPAPLRLMPQARRAYRRAGA